MAGNVRCRVSKFSHIFRSLGSLYQFECWYLGIWNNNHYIVSILDVGSWCHSDSIMGKIINLSVWIEIETFYWIGNFISLFMVSFFDHFQTILHVLSIAISLFTYYAFAMIYNASCVTCLKIPSTYYVIFVCLQSTTHWLVILLTVVIGILPK